MDERKKGKEEDEGETQLYICKNVTRKGLYKEISRLLQNTRISSHTFSILLLTKVMLNYHLPLTLFTS